MEGIYFEKWKEYREEIYFEKKMVADELWIMYENGTQNFKISEQLDKALREIENYDLETNNIIKSFNKLDKSLIETYCYNDLIKHGEIERGKKVNEK